MVNTVVITGRLTRDVELRSLDGGANVANFSVAVERNYVDKNTNERPCDFINVTAWRGTADFVAKYFHKGDMIAVEGSLQTRQYQDKDGNNRVATEVVANNISFCGGRSANTGNDAPATMVANAPSVPADDSDDLPF